MIAIVCVMVVFGLCAITPLFISGVPEDVVARE